MRDWHYVVRICNINLATITNADLIKFMIMASERISDQRLGRPVFYMRKETRVGA
jgi:hypothetical protein